MVDATNMNENVHYLTKEQADKNYGSKGVAGTGLGLGIAGTALGIMNSGGLLNTLFGGGFNNQRCSNFSDKEESEKNTNRYIQITKDYYQNKIDNLRELTESFYTLDQKIQAAKDLASAESRANFDSLNNRIIELEKAEAVQKATMPLYQVINDLKINGVNIAAQHGIHDTQVAAMHGIHDTLVASKNMVDALAMQAKTWVDFESQRRACGDNTIVNYVNSTFYPKYVADISTLTTTTQQPIYNPLVTQLPGI